jgi:hypothetical protein
VGRGFGSRGFQITSSLLVSQPEPQRIDCKDYLNPLSPHHSAVMSQVHPTATSSSNFQQIFDNALKAYQRRTKKDLLTHPLAAQLQACNSPSSILAVLQQQVQESNRSQSTDDRLTKWLDPTVNVLCALSDAFGEGASLVCSTTRPCEMCIFNCT